MLNTVLLKLWFAANPYNITAKEIGLPTSTGTVSEGLANIIKVLMSVVGMVAVVAIIYAGLRMVLSTGNPKNFADARMMLAYAVGGLALSIAAYAIVTFVTGRL